MKTFIIFVMLIFMSFQTYSINNQGSNKNAITQPQQPSLDQIEKRIYDAFVQSTIKNDLAPMNSIEEELKQIDLKKQQNLVWYWRAYLNYYKAIYYLKFADKEKSENACDEAVDWLKNMKNKTSEDYALQVLIQSFSIQFKGAKAMFVSSQIKKNAKKAIALDPKNLRANFVLASNDFYTPEAYGGGKKAEGYLTKAISLPASKLNNPYLPTWGKDQAYELLIRHYQKADQTADADRLLKEALAKFPDNYMLNSLAGQGKK